MKRVCRRFLIAVLIVLPHFLHADSVVGEITSLSGRVSIDAFGTGDFIDAMVGEGLYDASIVKTGTGATAVLIVSGQVTDLPPETTLAVGALVHTRERKSLFRWLHSLTEAAKSAFEAVTGKQEEVVMGGRAGDAGNDDQVGWVFEDEDEDAFSEALLLIGKSEFAQAVGLLKEIVDPLPGTFLPGEVDFWIGHCHYQLENYGAAIEAYTASLEDISAEQIEPQSLRYYPEMLFQTGSSFYLVGDFDGAVEMMESLIKNGSDRYATYTYLVLIDSLLETGATVRAKEYLDYATSHFSDSLLGDEFSALRRRFR